MTISDHSSVLVDLPTEAAVAGINASMKAITAYEASEERLRQIQEKEKEDRVKAKDLVKEAIRDFVRNL